MIASLSSSSCSNFFLLLFCLFFLPYISVEATLPFCNSWESWERCESLGFVFTPNEITASSVRLGDFDGDNEDDIVFIANSTTGSDCGFFVYINGGSGAFWTKVGSAGAVPSYSLGSDCTLASTSSLVTADYDGDGKDEISVRLDAGLSFFYYNGTSLSRVTRPPLYPTFKAMKEDYMSWIQTLRRFTTNHPEAETRYAPHLARLVKQSLHELEFYSSFERNRSFTRVLPSERFLSITGFDLGHGLNNIRVMYSLAFLYGSILNRTVILPKYLQREASLLVSFGWASGSTSVLSPELTLSSIFDLKQMRRRASSSSPPSSSSLSSYFPSSSLPLRFVEGAPSELEELVKNSTGFDEEGIYGSPTRRFFAWEDIELLFLLNNYKGIHLQLPYFFCDRSSTDTWKWRMRLNALWTFSPQIIERSQIILKSLAVIVEKEKEKEKEKEGGLEEGFAAIHVRVEMIYPFVCQDFYRRENPLLSYGAYPCISPFLRDTSCCYLAPEAIASKLRAHNLALEREEEVEDEPTDGEVTRSKSTPRKKNSEQKEQKEQTKQPKKKKIPKNLYLCGGHSGHKEVRRAFEEKGFKVWSKEDFLSRSQLWDEGSPDNLNFMWTALDMEIALKSDIFVGTSWSSFSFNVASERYWKALEELEKSPLRSPSNPSLSTFKYDFSPCSFPAEEDVEDAVPLSSFCQQIELPSEGEPLSSPLTDSELESFSCFNSCW